MKTKKYTFVFTGKVSLDDPIKAAKAFVINTMAGRFKRKLLCVNYKSLRFGFIGNDFELYRKSFEIVAVVYVKRKNKK